MNPLKYYSFHILLFYFLLISNKGYFISVQGGTKNEFDNSQNHLKSNKSE